ncbi:hypothetical protein CRR83_06060 [Salmonella enterica subsp. enterica serovar Schwarzengrund]|nr:hypothetical protein [Salmonella enterica]ECS3591207.1 hypothetical protein [Salmonella enterica subsp. enterica serovar Schwarzengrund]EDF9829472.1 hypothetical protein [Salmonella enterica subsp. enterica serovar Schwarzengrund]EDL3409727.1 hypothetical protein [Salmonella enterica subsp. enterica serovar Schwarzengrund]
MATLTKQEKAWVKKLNKLLAECPSDRIGFATIGDSDVFMFDLTRYDEIISKLDRGGWDFMPAAQHIGAKFDEVLRFPANVESTSG